MTLLATVVASQAIVILLSARAMSHIHRLPRSRFVLGLQRAGHLVDLTGDFAMAGGAASLGLALIGTLQLGLGVAWLMALEAALSGFMLYHALRGSLHLRKIMLRISSAPLRPE